MCRWRAYERQNEARQPKTGQNRTEQDETETQNYGEKADCGTDRGFEGRLTLGVSDMHVSFVWRRGTTQESMMIVSQTETCSRVDDWLAADTRSSSNLHNSIILSFPSHARPAPNRPWLYHYSNSHAKAKFPAPNVAFAHNSRRTKSSSSMGRGQKSGCGGGLGITD